MSNDNCLSGIRCPECGYEDSFFIRAEVTVEVTDDGTGDARDFDWSATSHISCADCRCAGTVGEFGAAAVAYRLGLAID